MAPIQVGIIGFGFSTKCFHLPFLLPNPEVHLCAFLQRRPASARAELKWGHCTVDFPSARHYTDLDSFLGDADVELVIVLTGDGTHAEFVLRALEAGKHGN